MGILSPARPPRFVTAALATAALSTVNLARAEEPPPDLHAAEPDTALAFTTGASVLVLGLGVGASLIGSDAGRTSDIGGWMVMQSTFAVAPFVAHGIAGEWGRGLLFSSPALATTAGTGTVFGLDSKAVRHSALPEQRVLWSLFVVGLFSSAYGVVDATFADTRARRRFTVLPAVGAGTAGIDIEGTL